MSFEIDRYAHLPSTIQRWDPRFKIAALGILIFLIALLQSLPLSFASLVIALLTFTLSGLPYRLAATGLKWLIYFLLPFFILLPMSFPTHAPLSVLGVTLAPEGLRLALLISVKAVAVVLLCYATFGSARFHHSMYALQKLRCPAFLIHMLLFTYRYIFVLIEEMRRMYKAMLSRGFQPRMNRHTLHILGYFVGNLLLRSIERTERIYKAMLSKGFDGEFHTLVTFQSKPVDWQKTLIFTALALLLWYGDHFGPFPRAIEAWY